MKMENRDGEIFEKFWSRRDDVCLGFNEGWYVGSDAVREFYHALEAQNMLAAKTLQSIFPEQLGGKSEEEIYGIGPLRSRPLYCAVIEAADDGETVKALWPCHGMKNEIGTNGPVVNWTLGYIAADFIREESGWRVWHLIFVNDVDSVSGQSWGKPIKPYPDLPEFAVMDGAKLPEYTVKECLREYYRPNRPITLAPRIPEPYASFSETFSYGYEKE